HFEVRRHDAALDAVHCPKSKQASNRRCGCRMASNIQSGVVPPHSKTGDTMRHWLLASTTIVAAAALPGAAQEKDNTPPPGFTALFNGKDLTNWQALVEVPEDAKAKK